jgi:hypothetical protein
MTGKRNRNMKKCEKKERKGKRKSRVVNKEKEE